MRVFIIVATLNIRVLAKNRSLLCFIIELRGH